MRWRGGGSCVFEGGLCLSALVCAEYSLSCVPAECAENRKGGSGTGVQLKVRELCDHRSEVASFSLRKNGSRGRSGRTAWRWEGSSLRLLVCAGGLPPSLAGRGVSEWRKGQMLAGRGVRWLRVSVGRIGGISVRSRNSLASFRQPPRAWVGRGATTAAVVAAGVASGWWYVGRGREWWQERRGWRGGKGGGAAELIDVPLEWSKPYVRRPSVMECVMRSLDLMVDMMPLVLTAPWVWLVSGWMPTAAEAWWRWVEAFVGTHGPTIAKSMQWAAMRRDLFPEAFCKRMQKLHAEVPAHHWEHTNETMASAFGSDWQNQLRLDRTPIGSGCVAQVYKGNLKSDDGEEKNIAVKVVHPQVKTLAEVDLELLRFVASLFDAFLPLQNTICLVNCVEEFALPFLEQMDMRVEAFHLAKFRRNFASDCAIHFPEPFADLSSELVLVESYEEGLSAHRSSSGIVSDQGRRLVARRGISAFLSMLFRHNFIHGDLHAGNVLLDPQSDEIVILDAGIAFSIDAHQTQNLYDLFKSIVQGDGRHAGQLLIERSGSNVVGKDFDLFCDGVQKIVDDAIQGGLRLERLGIGELLSKVLSLCYTYGVRLESKFASIVTSLYVAEGLGRLLDPHMDIFNLAVPIILKSRVSAPTFLSREEC